MESFRVNKWKGLSQSCHTEVIQIPVLMAIHD